MQPSLQILAALLLLAASALGQGARLWVLEPSGDMVEYDPATFASKQTVKVPAQAAQSPLRVSVNPLGQILFAPAVSLPLSEEDTNSNPKIWIWNGRSASTVDLGARRELAKAGSNLAVTESAPAVVLAADGAHLFWFANRARRLERESVDLSTTTTWLAWQTDLSGAERQDLVTVKMPECTCSTGSCEETCPYGAVWSPPAGVGTFFLMTQFVAGQTGVNYLSSTLYRTADAKWAAQPLAGALQQVLDTSSDGNVIVEAIPDSACCGWSNQSDDQTLLLADGRKLTIFDELAIYKNSDYDVSFSTLNAKLSPDLNSVAMTITSSAKPNQPIQLSEQGQANPAESKRIRAALTELPAIEVKSVALKGSGDPRRIAYVPHATLVGWLDAEEILIFENHLLVAYNVVTGARRKSVIRVEDAVRVFLR